MRTKLKVTAKIVEGRQNMNKGHRGMIWRCWFEEGMQKIGLHSTSHSTALQMLIVTSDYKMN